MENNQSVVAEKLTPSPIEINVREYYWPKVEKILGPRHIMASIEEVDKRIRPKIQSIIDNLYTDGRKGAYIMGNIGSGKSSVLSILFKAAIEHKFRRVVDWLRENGREHVAHYNAPSIEMDFKLIYITHSELIREIRGHIKEHDESSMIPYRLANADIIFIDDFGRAYDDKAGWNVSIQDEFFDWRWVNKKHLFITSNYRPDTIREWEGYGRIISRITDPGYADIIQVPGGDRRK